MQLEDSWLQQAGPGSEIAVLKPERETAVRALLKERDVLAVLPTGYSPREKEILSLSEKISKKHCTVSRVNFKAV